jgi:hypothetical protein
LISAKEFSAMSKIIPARVTAQLDGDFVVFLIGMRVNKWWKLVDTGGCGDAEDAD